jgi:hypothetical protein
MFMLQFGSFASRQSFLEAPVMYRDDRKTLEINFGIWEDKSRKEDSGYKRNFDNRRSGGGVGEDPTPKRNKSGTLSIRSRDTWGASSKF